MSPSAPETAGRKQCRIEFSQSVSSRVMRVCCLAWKVQLMHFVACVIGSGSTVISHGLLLQSCNKRNSFSCQKYCCHTFLLKIVFVGIVCDCIPHNFCPTIGMGSFRECSTVTSNPAVIAGLQPHPTPIAPLPSCSCSYSLKGYSIQPLTAVVNPIMCLS